METIIIDKDIKVFYTTASSFPAGIEDAMKKIYAIAPHAPGRRFFGISRPEGSQGIMYRAAAEKLKENEGNTLGCDTLVLKKGNYISEVIANFGDEPGKIGKTFQHLLNQKGLDPQGYCVEWHYNNTDVRCMIRLAE